MNYSYPHNYNKISAELDSSARLILISFIEFQIFFLWVCLFAFWSLNGLVFFLGGEIDYTFKRARGWDSLLLATAVSCARMNVMEANSLDNIDSVVIDASTS